MSQHVHLVLQVGDEPLAKNLQNVSFRHTRWINGKQQRLGPLVQGRCLENDSARYDHIELWGDLSPGALKSVGIHHNFLPLVIDMYVRRGNVRCGRFRHDVV